MPDALGSLGLDQKGYSWGRKRRRGWRERGRGKEEKMEKGEEGRRRKRRRRPPHLRHRPLWGNQTPGLVESENSSAGEELRLLKSISLHKDYDKIAAFMVTGSYY